VFDGSFHSYNSRLFVTLAADVTPQEVKHAPTGAQCQADRRLWIAEVSNSASDLDYHTLTARELVMGDCISVDPDNNPLYMSLGYQLIALQDIRLRHFVERHGLYDQFIKEDKEGKR